MDEQLIVHGGGSTAVAVDELFVEVARLDRLAAVAREWGGQLEAIRAALHDSGLTAASPGFASSMLSASAVDAGLGGAASAIERCARASDRLSAELLTSAERYGQAEREAALGWRWFVGSASWAVGTAPLPAAGLAATSAALVLLAAAFGAAPDPREVDWRRVFSRPEFVALVRAAADSPDELLAGLAHLPLAASLRLGEGVGAPHGAALLVSAAAALARLAPAARGDAGDAGAVLVDRAVRVEPAGYGPPSAVPPTAPRGVGDLAERVPPRADGGPQVRIERYGEGVDARYLVYVAGTVTFDVHAGSEPFDMTSNLHGIADDAPSSDVPPSGMESAVRAALSAAGAEAASPVLVVGYSGGGIAAAELAAAPDLNVVGALTMGSPTASAPPTHGVPVLALEHAEDLVPATGGSGIASPDRLVVSRSALGGSAVDGAVAASEGALPGHALQNYQQTARLVDGSEEPRLVAFRQVVDGFADGEAAEVTLWRARRIEGSG